MKKIICLALVLISLFVIVSCNESETKSKTKSESTTNEVDESDTSFQLDIKIEDLDWSFGNGTVNNKEQVVMQFTNNSEYTINKFEVKFEEKDGLSEEEKKEIYSDIQKSQGFDDEYMDKYIKSKNDLGESITMRGKCDEPVEPNNTSETIRCFFFGGWNSIGVLHADKMKPVAAIISYDKDGTEHTITYDFESETYEME